MVSLGYVMSLLASFHLATLCYAAPLSNETITAATAAAATAASTAAADAGLLEGSCTLGDVVYMAGDEWSGSSSCERCRCSGGAVSCAREHCEPRPGCKALHRPDQCCPIYQCECEQEGRIYGNGEKLVDPQDPCRVCYCQGGEVVCRRIACFVRDDCRPRAVPGRCCPEYDNCPLRGVTVLPGVAPTHSNVTSTNQVEADISTTLPSDNIKQEITIKEITPVSEIPVMTDVKIKEILPSTSVEVTEFTSSKSPLIVREATSEKSQYSVTNVVTEIPGIIEKLPSSISTAFPVKLSENILETKTTDNASPSKISLSTQDSINSELYPSPTPSETTHVTFIPVMASTTAATTRPPIVEEEEPSIIEHNPAFPPIPDDLSVAGNHDDDSMTEQNLDGEHVSDVADASVSHQTSTAPDVTPTKENIQNFKSDILEKSKSSVSILAQTTVTEIVSVTEIPKSKESPMLNLRSAIPTEILNAPSALPEDITGELDDAGDNTTPEMSSTFGTSSTTNYSENSAEIITTSVEPVFSTNEKYENDVTNPTLSTHHETDSPLLKGMTNIVTNDDSETSTAYDINGSLNRRKETGSTNEIVNSDTTQALFASTASSKINQDFTEVTTEATRSNDMSTESSSQELQGQKASTASKQLPEITSQTEFSSLPVETSDQNPQDSISKEKDEAPVTIESYVTDGTKAIEKSPERVPVTENRSFDNFETTEFILNKFESSEVVTDNVEFISSKLSPNTEKNAALITQVTRKPNYLDGLNDLVGDIVSIGENNEPTVKKSTAPALPSSEEFIPFNAGYKSKNNNWNVNSISEVPPKIKSQNSGVKQRIEIEDDESHITDSAPPHDKVEPTTRRPIIDNVSNDMPENKTTRKDIEILTQSYVPTLNRGPTKVVMKKSHEDKVTDAPEDAEVSTTISSELNTTFKSTTGVEYPGPSTTLRVIERTTDETNSFKILDLSTIAPIIANTDVKSTRVTSTSPDQRILSTSAAR